MPRLPGILGYSNQNSFTWEKCVDGCWGQNSFTWEKAVDIGVYSVGSQTRGFFLHGKSAPPPYLVQDYEQNGFGEKRGRVKLNRLSDHKMGESYGARPGSGNRKLAEGFRKRERVRESRE